MRMVAFKLLHAKNVCEWKWTTEQWLRLRRRKTMDSFRLIFEYWPKTNGQNSRETHKFAEKTNEQNDTTTHCGWMNEKKLAKMTKYLELWTHKNSAIQLCTQKENVERNHFPVIIMHSPFFCAASFSIEKPIAIEKKRVEYFMKMKGDLVVSCSLEQKWLCRCRILALSVEICTISASFHVQIAQKI